jgi:pimeloyl-ACP methyl ester carboxylesterase
VTRLHTVEWGRGTPVVFVHGLGGSTHTWDRVREVSGDGYRGIAVDLLGFGRSPKPADARYDMACHVEHLVEVVPEGSVLVGHSAGALIALALAVRHAGVVRGLVLCSLPAYPDRETARRDIGRLGLVARITVDRSRAAQATCWIMCRTRWLWMLLAPLATRMPSAVARDTLRHTYASYDRTLHNVVVEHRAEDDLARVAVPAMLLHGRDDDVAPLAQVEAVAPSGAMLRVVDGDHHLPIGNAGACAAALEDLCSQISRA